VLLLGANLMPCFPALVVSTKSGDLTSRYLQHHRRYRVAVWSHSSHSKMALGANMGLAVPRQFHGCTSGIRGSSMRGSEGVFSHRPIVDDLHRLSCMPTTIKAWSLWYHFPLLALIDISFQQPQPLPETQNSSQAY
jgi:hypothetical protein